LEEKTVPEHEQVDKYKTAYEVIEQRLTALWSAIDSVATKTNIILGFASVILVVLAGFYSLENITWPCSTLVLFILAIATYVITVVLSLWSYRISAWSYRPDPDTLIEHSMDESCSLADLRRWVATECTAALKDNKSRLDTKAKLTNCVLGLFALETVFLVSGLAIAMINS